MGFHQTRFLLDDVDKPDLVKKPNPCFICYDGCPKGCRGNSRIPPSPPSSNHQIPTVLILMLCVLAAAFVFLVYVTIRRYRWNLRNSRRRNALFLDNVNNNRQDFIDEDQEPVVDHPIWYIRTIGLPQCVIDSIAVFKYEKGQGLIEGTDCSVCLNEFEEDENLRLLPKCSHAFHIPCIDTWLRSHKNCPVCRAPVLIPNTAPVDTVGANSNGLSSMPEEAGTDRELEQSVVEINETGEMRDGVETIHSVPTSVRPPNLRNDKLRVLSDLIDNRVKFDEELQPVRRSISMDFSSASVIYNRVADIQIQAKRDEGCSDTKLAIVGKQNSDTNAKSASRNSSIYRLLKSASLGRSLQKGPIPMKRSSSFTLKHPRRNYSTSHDLLPIRT